MILKSFTNRQLAQTTYLVGCPGAAEAIVIDAGRDLEPILEAAAEDGLRIVAVTETHIHADYVSGSRELSARTGATLYLSGEGGPDWQYAFAQEPNVTLIRDGDTLRAGAIRLDVIHTPGHTPEHLTFVLTDESATDTVLGAFTGDFLFVGDVGRPDLLERAAGHTGTMAASARSLFASLRSFADKMPDSLLIWPAHGAGSACGKSLGGVPVSTLGYERRANWALQIDDETAFVEAVLKGQPEPPAYFREMKRINKEGPAGRSEAQRPVRMGPALLARQLRSATLVVDTRPATEALTSLAAGTLNVPLGRQFANFVGWFAPYDAPIALIARNQAEADQAADALLAIGLDHVPQWFHPSALNDVPTDAVKIVSPAEVARQLDTGQTVIVDVRGLPEVEAEPIPASGAESIHIPFGHLARRASELPKERPIVAVCASGGRATIAATVLRRLGFQSVSAMRGGPAELAQALSEPPARLR